MVPESLGAERDFGDFLIRRGAGTPQWIYAGLLLGLSALCIWVAVAGAKKEGQIEWSAVGCSSVFGLLGWITFQLARVKTEFYRHGVIQRRGRRVLRFMAYSDCDRFIFLQHEIFGTGSMSLRLLSCGWRVRLTPVSGGLEDTKRLANSLSRFLVNILR